MREDEQPDGMAGMTKLTAVFHNLLANASKNITFGDRIHCHSQEKWYVKTHTTGSDRQGFFLELWAQKFRMSMRHDEK